MNTENSTLIKIKGVNKRNKSGLRIKGVGDKRLLFAFVTDPFKIVDQMSWLANNRMPHQIGHCAGDFQ